MNNTDALLVLNAVKGLGNAGIRKLIEIYGSAVKVLTLKKSELSAHAILPIKILRNIAQFPRDDFLRKEFEQIAKKRIKVLTFLDKDYPRLLKEIPGAPSVLYVKGNLPADNSLPIAMVGSRRASYYGVSNAHRFARRLAELGFTVISGMARGIDSEAHKGALKAGGITMAVLGCGLSHVYPLENRGLMEEITETGTVISEFPMGMPPLAANFPRRNRIISGLSLGVIVVEAAQRSGALITADFALEQGREVFAVPGKIDSTMTQGVHNLINRFMIRIYYDISLFV